MRRTVNRRRGPARAARRRRDDAPEEPQRLPGRLRVAPRDGGGGGGQRRTRAPVAGDASVGGARRRHPLEHVPPAAVRQPLRRRRLAGGGGRALQVPQVPGQAAALGFPTERALRRGQQLQQSAVVPRQVAGHAVGHELGDGGGAAAGARRGGQGGAVAALRERLEHVRRKRRLPLGPRPRRPQALMHVRHQARGERGVPPRAVRRGAPPEHRPRHGVHERARVPVARARQVAVRGARHRRRDGVRGVEGARCVHREQRHHGVGAVPQTPEPAAGAARGLGLGGQAPALQRELLRGAVHQVRGALVGAHLQRALEPEPRRLGGVRGRPRAVRGAAHSLRQAQRPLQVVRGRALRDRGRGVHRAADAGGDEFRPISGFGFLKCLGVPRLGQPLGGVVVAAAAAQAPLRELHVVEQLPVAHGEARGAAARLALRELGK